MSGSNLSMEIIRHGRPFLPVQKAPCTEAYHNDTTIKLKTNKSNAKIHQRERRTHPTPTGCWMYLNFITAPQPLSNALSLSGNSVKHVSGIRSFSLFNFSTRQRHTPFSKIALSSLTSVRGEGQACPWKWDISYRNKCSKIKKGKWFYTQ